MKVCKMVSVRLRPSTYEVAKRYAKDKKKPLSTLMKEILSETIRKSKKEPTDDN